MDLNLKYADKLPYFPEHNIGIRFAIPIKNNWSLNLNYYKHLSINGFRRLALGIESSMLVHNKTVELSTFPGQTAKADTSYIFGAIAPSVSFWITNPMERFYALYFGVSAPFIFPENQISISPFIGSRLYIDLNKAITLEMRYHNFNFESVNYSFNPYGNAQSLKTEDTFEQIMINLGLQVSF